MTENNSNKKGFRTLNSAELGFESIEKDSAIGVGFSTWVRTLMQNWRQGTVACKGRSDVSFTNKKPWKQKGTGRARAGSARSPLWRGGGVIFGPQARVRTLKVPKAVKTNVLRNIVLEFVERNAIYIAPWVPFDVPKTAKAAELLNSMGLRNQKVNLLISLDDIVTHSSFANLPNVKIYSFDEVNAFALASCDSWLVFENDLPKFKEMVSKWS